MPKIFDKHLQNLQNIIPELITELTVDARNFFDESWDNQGFTDTGLDKWKKSKDKNGNDKQNTLVQSGILRRSIRTETTDTEGLVFTEVGYAEVHNEGLDISTTQSIGKFVRRSRKGKKHEVSQHQRKVNFKMPKRQFMGESETLNEMAEETILRKLNEMFN